jgi:class 3 adenylate cyclase
MPCRAAPIAIHKRLTTLVRSTSIDKTATAGWPPVSPADKSPGGLNLDIDGWLRRIGLEQYAQTFRENGIDLSVLPDLTDQDLEKLGVLLGHRRKLLRAIADFEAIEKSAPAGAAAATAPAALPLDTAERRQLTIMFCDLVGSTALSTRLDPEDMREIVGAYHRCSADLITRAGGFVARYMGDGVLAYFGYPQAHEHDAERATRAGLSLVEAVPKLKTAAGVPLQLRVGIATGLVVVGDLIGVGAAQEHEVVGETPNLAARLQALAEPGTVAISSSTQRLTGGLFDYRDLGTVALKGFAENVPAWQALGASAAESRFEALRASTTPLVGRGEEIDLLLRRWEQAKGGEGSVVLLSGEPGIGKSRIAETVLDRLSGEPHTRLRLFCSPHHQDSAFYPSIAQLERAAGFRRDDTDQQRLTKLEAVLALAANDLGEAAPLLADLLSIPTGDRYPALDLTPQRRKEKALRALVAQVEGLAARQPVLLVVEDAHWADPTSLELIDLIVERASPLPLLAIVTFRPEFVPPWVGRPQVTLISLNRLPRRLRAEMIAHLTGGKVLPPGNRPPDHRSDRWRAAVHRGTDQGRGRERPARGSRRSVCGDGSGDCAGDPDIAPGIAPGAARSPGADKRRGADRRGSWTTILARTDQLRGGDAAAAAG